MTLGILLLHDGTYQQVLNVQRRIYDGRERHEKMLRRTPKSSIFTCVIGAHIWNVVYYWHCF